MGSAAASIEDSIFCDRCGEAFAEETRVCWLRSDAGTALASTHKPYGVCARGVLQCAGVLVSAAAAGKRAKRAGIRGWLWLDEKASIYGWAPIIMAILAWDYFIWRRSRRAKQTGHKIKGWITRKLLTFVLVTAVTPLLPWWIPAGQPPDSFIARISRYPGLPSSLAWLTVTLVLVLLVWNPATRDSLLGHGRILSLISIATLFVLLAMTLLGWSLTYY